MNKQINKLFTKTQILILVIMATTTCLVIVAMGGIVFSQMLKIPTQEIIQEPSQVSSAVTQNTPTATLVPTREIPPTWTPIPVTPTSRPPSQTDSAVSGIAANYVATQEQAGVKIELIRVLCIDGNLAHDEIGLTDSQYDGMRSACEFILQITNNSDKVIDVFPQEGTVVVNGEQINLLDYPGSIADLEYVDGTIYPNVTRIGGFWYPVRRSNWFEINSMSYIIQAPTNENSESLGDKYYFEINLSGWGFEPFPQEISGLVVDTNNPTESPTPSFAEQTQSLGPLWDSLRDEFFSVKLKVTQVEWFSEYDYMTPKTGYIYLVAHLTIENLGPGSVYNFGPYNFKARDENGALRDEAFLMTDCQLDMVDLMPEGKISGCVSFEVPLSGSIELIYAPYQYEGLEAGRYLSFTLRP